MAVPAALHRELGQIQKTIESLVQYDDFVDGTGKPKSDGLPAGKRKAIINRSRVLLNQATKQSLQFFDSLADKRQFTNEYNKTAGIMRDAGFPLENWTGKTPSELHHIRKEFLSRMTASADVAMYTVREKLRLMDSMLKRESKAYKMREKLKKDTDLKRDERERLIKANANKIYEEHRPRFTLLKQESELIDTTKERRALLGNFKNAENQVTDILRRAQTEGWTYSEKKRRINEVTSRYFPDGKVTYMRYTKDGRAIPVSMDLRVYNEQWALYGQSRLKSRGTLGAMERTGADIVEWKLRGSNHSPICLEIHRKGPYYSISGKSKKYPPLPTMPPAHPYCKSYLAPAPMKMQEWRDPDDIDMEAVADKGFVKEADILKEESAWKSKRKDFPETMPSAQHYVDQYKPKNEKEYRKLQNRIIGESFRQYQPQDTVLKMRNTNIDLRTNVAEYSINTMKQALSEIKMLFGEKTWSRVKDVQMINIDEFPFYENGIHDFARGFNRSGRGKYGKDSISIANPGTLSSRQLIPYLKGIFAHEIAHTHVVRLYKTRYRSPKMLATLAKAREEIANLYMGLAMNNHRVFDKAMRRLVDNIPEERIRNKILEDMIIEDETFRQRFLVWMRPYSPR